eukprot:scpid62563/ scgid15212/ 
MAVHSVRVHKLIAFSLRSVANVRPAFAALVQYQHVSAALSCPFSHWCRASGQGWALGPDTYSLTGYAARLQTSERDCDNDSRTCTCMLKHRNDCIISSSLSVSVTVSW